MRSQITAATFVLLSVVLISIASCGAGVPVPAPSPPRQSALPQVSSNSPLPFHLYVSNQSFDHDPARIDVLLDGLRVVEGDFFVESQHAWHRFDFVLDPGSHELQTVLKGEATTLRERFALREERWAVIDFWFTSSSHAGQSQPKHFGWQLRTAAPQFH